MIRSNLFSVCAGHKGGYITFGDYWSGPHHPNASMKSIFLDQDYTIYRANLQSVSVGSSSQLSMKDLKVSEKAVIDLGYSFVKGPVSFIE